VVQIVSCGVPPPPATITLGATDSVSFIVCLAGDVNAIPTAVTTNCLPVATCTLTVTPVPGKAGAYTVTVSIATTASIVPLQDPPSRLQPWPMVFFVSPLLLLGTALLLSRSRGRRQQLAYGAGLVLALAIAGVSGCSSPSSSLNKGGTPLGSFTINVNVTAGNFSVVVPVSVTVTK